MGVVLVVGAVLLILYLSKEEKKEPQQEDTANEGTSAFVPNRDGKHGMDSRLDTVHDDFDDRPDTDPAPGPVKKLDQPKRTPTRTQPARKTESSARIPARQPERTSEVPARTEVPTRTKVPERKIPAPERKPSAAEIEAERKRKLRAAGAARMARGNRIMAD